MHRLTLCLCVLLAVVPLVVSCNDTKCGAHDLGCFLDNLVLVEPHEGGEKLKLVSVSRSRLAPRSIAAPSAAGSGGARATGAAGGGGAGGRGGGGAGTGATGGAAANCTKCNGVCTAVANDPNNCGACGTSCAPLGPGAVCTNGQCACGPGRSVCNGACVSFTSDPANCGKCGNSCAEGAACSGGACEPTCSAPLTKCVPNGITFGGFACVDTQTDYANCGGCANVCPGGYGCHGGTCSCDDPICMTPDPPMVSSEAPQWEGAPPERIFIGRPNELHRFKQKCRDGFMCTPAVCFSVCSGSHCESSLRCTPPTGDGSTEPTFDAYVGFLAESEGMATFSLQATPVSGPGCSELVPDDGNYSDSAFQDWLESDTTLAGDSEDVSVIDFGSADSSDDSSLGSPSTYTSTCTASVSSFSCCSNGSCSTIPGTSSMASGSFSIPAGESITDETDTICSQIDAAWSSSGCSNQSCRQTTGNVSDVTFVASCTIKESGCDDATVTETCRFVEQ